MSTYIHPDTGMVCDAKGPICTLDEWHDEAARRRALARRRREEHQRMLVGLFGSAPDAHGGYWATCARYNDAESRSTEAHVYRLGRTWRVAVRDTSRWEGETPERWEARPERYASFEEARRAAEREAHTKWGDAYWVRPA